MATFFITSCNPDEEDLETLPTLTVSDIEISVDENTASGTSIGKIEATTTTGTITFTEKSSDANGAIVVDTDGTIRVDDVTELDYEVRQNITIIVEVTNDTDTEEITLSVVILDVDDDVFITVSDFEVSVNENTESGRVLDKLTATTNEGTLIFSIKSTDGNGAILVENDGTIKVDDTSELDFEKREKITIIVTVTNGAISKDFTLTVNILDVDETTASTGPALSLPAERGLVSIVENNNGVKITYTGRNFEAININLHNSVTTLPEIETTYQIVGSLLSSEQATIAYSIQENNTITTYVSHLAENGGSLTIKPLDGDKYEVKIAQAQLKTFSFDGTPSEEGVLDIQFTGIKTSVDLSSTNQGTFTGLIDSKKVDIVSFISGNRIILSGEITQVSPVVAKMEVSISIPKGSTSGTYTVNSGLLVPTDFSGKNAYVSFTEAFGADNFRAQSGTIEITVDGDFYTASFTELTTIKITSLATGATEASDNKISGTITGERRKYGSLVDN